MSFLINNKGRDMLKDLEYESCRPNSIILSDLQTVIVCGNTCGTRWLEITTCYHILSGACVLFSTWLEAVVSVSSPTSHI